MKHIKSLISAVLINKLHAYQEIVSLSIVGSFLQKDDISAVSDIDTIIILEKLSKSNFNYLIDQFKTITGEECGLPGYTVIINSTFGPLKFHAEKVIVFHVMIYDIVGHRKHVIESPFTCNDWENGETLLGKKLREIYPATPLQLQDIFGTRRSFNSYLADLKKTHITFRKYSFENDLVEELEDTCIIDGLKRQEYVYHVIKFMLLNILKIIKQHYRFKSDEMIINEFSLLDSRFSAIVEIFSSLSEWKNKKKAAYSLHAEEVEHELIGLHNWYSNLILTLPQVKFFRHASTNLNDGTFLGIMRDPDINQINSFDTTSFDICYTSNLKRAISTGNLLFAKSYEKTDLLNEINYGDGEGMTYQQMANAYPSIIEKWKNNLDTSFPNGENLAEVENRLDTFINNFIFNSPYSNIAVVTHNVVLRVLLDKIYQFDRVNCYKFLPQHTESISFRIHHNTLIPDMNSEQMIRFRDQYMQWN